MAAIADTGERKLDIGRVIAQLFKVIGRQPVMTIGLALAAALISAGMMLLFGVTALRGATGAASLAVFTSPGYWLTLLVAIFVGAYLEACLFFIVVSELSGRKLSLGDVAANGARLFLPLFVINLLSGIAIGIGCMLLIVPGLMLATAWCVAGPALIAERIGIFETYGRSAELTRNNRWRIFGLGVIFFVVVIILQAVLRALGLASVMTAGGIAGAVIGNIVLSTITTLVSYAGIAVLYAELRQLKDGVGGESLAAVFD